MSKIRLDDRKLLFADTDLEIAVTSDDLSEGLEFEVPTKYNEEDLTDKDVYIDFENSNGQSGSTKIDANDIKVVGENMVFTYYIPEGVTAYKGNAKIALRYLKTEQVTDEETGGKYDKTLFRWNSLPLSFEVLEGIANDLEIYVSGNPTKIDEIDEEIAELQEQVDSLETREISLDGVDLDTYDYQSGYTYITTKNCTGGPLTTASEYCVIKRSNDLQFLDLATGVQYVRLATGVYVENRCLTNNSIINEYIQDGQISSNKLDSALRNKLDTIQTLQPYTLAEGVIFHMKDGFVSVNIDNYNIKEANKEQLVARIDTLYRPGVVNRVTIITTTGYFLIANEAQSVAIYSYGSRTGACSGSGIYVAYY